MDTLFLFKYMEDLHSDAQAVRVSLFYRPCTLSAGHCPHTGILYRKWSDFLGPFFHFPSVQLVVTQYHDRIEKIHAYDHIPIVFSDIVERSFGLAFTRLL